MSGPMAESTRGNGKIIKWKATVYSHGPMVEDTRESTSMIKRKAGESSTGK